MEKIDGNWIKSRLTGAHGEKARLAEAMGLSDSKVSKILSGERLVKASEIPTLLRFFGLDGKVTGTQAQLQARIGLLTEDRQAQAAAYVDFLLAQQQTRKADQD